mmetsp:Transcript_16819/g.25283  ORF Transcript_16819/g.25283 Transcript_16819/m.25283 type:complete len:1239 (+) Transcript_16819:216-3932(+)|eukprot:CAMPEP_0185027124 /NCGR_PEP_ID=MMETSP1103-20130426/11918_1 /TAXON_ID=36769 /ORGANISM="Paraphysomonas bandaiensis, Strain Caron Lab Isolate" /LENGTH=1238 /DNA_ID=CAMNT_0027560983 /DNA_START=159 /DNA_END=3875 /DNA_ORIENTATION=-
MKLNFLNPFKTKKQIPEEDVCKAERGSESDASSVETDTADLFVVMEHERWRVDLGWSHRNLEVGDPKRFVSKLHESNEDLEPMLPPGWVYVNEWKIDMKVPGADDGWLYAYDFRTLDGTQSMSGDKFYVRRRKWVRGVGIATGEGSVAGETESRDEYTSVISGEDGEGPRLALTGRHDEDAAVEEFEQEEDEEDEIQDEDVEAMLHSTAALKAKVHVIRDPALIAIGKQMKAIEAECKKADEKKMKEWTKTIAPSYKTTIRELDKRIDALRKRIKAEAGVGDAHIALLEEELQAHLEVQDSTKRNLYFPNSALAVGSAGVYFALDDFWLEQASGQFILDLVPSKESPQIILLLTGTSDKLESGVSFRLKIGGFKLRGDSGKGVPRLALDSLKVTMTLRVTMMLTYSVSRKCWMSSAQDFRVEMLYFKGPFGLSRSVVAGTLAIVVPILRGQLLSALPSELGLFISSLPSPMSIRGEFDIQGTELKHLSHAMFKSSEMCALVGYSPEQLLKFLAIQKSIDKKPLLKTMQDLLKYRRLGTTHHKQWDQLRVLWNQAAVLYFDKASMDSSVSSHQVTMPISFERLLQGTDEILRNPLAVKFTLHNLDGQFSMRSVIDNTQLIFERWRDSKNSSQDIGQLVMLLQKFNQQLDRARDALALTTYHLDFIDLRLALNMLAGAKGELGITISDILAQAPLAVWTAMPKDLSFGFEAPVPFVITVRPKDEGNIDIEVFHLGSKEIQYRSEFAQWQMKQDAVKEKQQKQAFKTTTSVMGDFPDAACSTGSVCGDVKADDRFNISAPSTPDRGTPIPSADVFKDMLGSSANTVGGISPDRGSPFAIERQATYQSEISEAASEDYAAPSVVSMESDDPTPSTRFPVASGRNRAVGTISGGGPMRRRSVLTSARTRGRQTEHFISYSERQRRDLEKTLQGRPRPREAHRILSVRVLRPHMSIIVDAPVTLKPGSELFTFRVGPLEKDWKPFGYESERRPAHTRSSLINRHASVLNLARPEVVQQGDTEGSAASSVGKNLKAGLYDVDDEESDFGAEIVETDGCPVLVQTSGHIKVLAQIPNIQISFHLARLLRFFSLYFDNIDILRSYLGITSERAKEETEEYIYLFKVLVDRLGKYLLLPNLELSVNISTKIVATDQDVNVTFESSTQEGGGRCAPAGGAEINEGDIEGSENKPSAIYLYVKLNVMDVIADAVAIKNSLLRCAQVYERHCEEDAAAPEKLQKDENTSEN